MPTPTIREQIVAYIKSALQGISGNGIYQTEVDNVYDFDVASFESIADDIYCGVFVRSLSIQRNLTRVTHGADCPASLIVGIRAIMRDAVDDIEQTKTQLISDIQRAIWAQVDLGLSQFCVRIESMSFDQEVCQPFSTGAIAMFMASVVVSFLTDPSQP